MILSGGVAETGYTPVNRLNWYIESSKTKKPEMLRIKPGTIHIVFVLISLNISPSSIVEKINSAPGITIQNIVK